MLTIHTYTLLVTPRDKDRLWGSAVFVCQWALQLCQDIAHLPADPSDSSGTLISRVRLCVCVHEPGALQCMCLHADNTMLTQLASLHSVSEDTLCSERESLWWQMSYKLARSQDWESYRYREKNRIQPSGISKCIYPQTENSSEF